MIYSRTTDFFNFVIKVQRKNCELIAEVSSFDPIMNYTFITLFNIGFGLFGISFHSLYKTKLYSETLSTNST